MSDLISRQALMKEFSDFVRESNNSDFAPTPTWNDAVSLVGSMPSAERRGRWIKHPWGGGVHTCSVCGKRANIILANGYLTGDASPSGETGGYYHYDRKELLSNYCPNCGAKMDGEEE